MKKITEILKRIMEENDAMQKATQINLDLISEEMNAIDYHTQKKLLSDSTANMAQLMHHPRRWGGSILSTTKNSFKLEDNESSASTSPYNHRSDKNEGHRNSSSYSNYNISASENYLFFKRNFSPSSTSPNSVYREKDNDRDWRSPHSILSEKTEGNMRVDEIKEMDDIPKDILDVDKEEEVIVEGDNDKYGVSTAPSTNGRYDDVIPKASTSSKS